MFASAPIEATDASVFPVVEEDADKQEPEEHDVTYFLNVQEARNEVCASSSLS